MDRAVYDFQPPDRRTAIGKRREAVSGEIMQFDDAMLESELDAMIRTRVEDAANATPDASGRRDRGRRRIRARDRSEGVPGRPLRAQADGRDRRRGSGVEEALTEMRPAGVSTRRVDGAGRLPWGGVFLADAFRRARACVCRDRWAGEAPAGGGEWPCVFVDGVWRRRSRGGRVGNVGILVAVGIDADGAADASARTTRSDGRAGRSGSRHVAGCFPDGNGALMLVCAGIRYVTANGWSTRRYPGMPRLGDGLVGAN